MTAATQELGAFEARIARYHGVSLQDVLGPGSEVRMNTPAVTGGN